jgi:hypothetical protein
MALRKLSARIDCIEGTGQPKFLFINPDGMEARKTNLPKVYIKTKHSESGKVIEQRLMGVEVVCGPLHCTLCFICDNMAYGGQDLMIEIYRLTIFYVQKLLKYFWNFELPKVSFFNYFPSLFCFILFYLFLFCLSDSIPPAG